MRGLNLYVLLLRNFSLRINYYREFNIKLTAESFYFCCMSSIINVENFEALLSEFVVKQILNRGVRLAVGAVK